MPAPNAAAQIPNRKIPLFPHIRHASSPRRNFRLFQHIRRGLSGFRKNFKNASADLLTVPTGTRFRFCDFTIDFFPRCAKLLCAREKI